MTKRSVFISGGGPAGLAAALLFDQLGWDEVVLAERRSGPSDFEKNKSFNYLVDKRSQRLFERLGILDRLPKVGVATTDFVATTITPDGKAETKGVPIIDPDRPVCYWTTRRALLTMLYEAIGERASDRTTLLYGHKVARLGRTEEGGLSVEVSDGDGNARSFEPDLVLACDGLNSAIRAGITAMPDIDPKRFEMIATPSLSTGLRYKVLNLPSRFATKGGAAVDDPEMSYILPSRHKDRTKACALFAFPVSDASHPRSVNLIREPDHELWTLRTADDLLAFLEDSFPQLAVRELVSREEAEDFVSLEAGAFPAPQYAASVLASFGRSEKRSHALLIGDAAHAFPPDLGLGVNSALQDVDVLADHLEGDGDLETALTSYAARQVPEARDLCWLVTHVFPEQYNHRPWRLRGWVAGFMLRRGLNSLAPHYFARPGFFLTQDPDLTYGEMRQAIEDTDKRLKMAGIGSLALGATAAALALRG